MHMDTQKGLGLWELWGRGFRVPRAHDSGFRD